VGVIHQLSVLDGIDLERFSVRPIDPRHEPAIQ